MLHSRRHGPGVAVSLGRQFLAAIREGHLCPLLDSYHDSGVKPAYGTPEYKRYAECYYIICGSQLGR